MTHTRGNHSDDFQDREPCDCDMPTTPQPPESVESVIRESEVLRTDNCIYFRGEMQPELAGEIARVEEKTVFILGDCEVIENDVIKAALTRSRLDTLEEVLRGMPEEKPICRCPQGCNDARAFNACRAAVITMIEGLRKEGV